MPTYVFDCYSSNALELFNKTVVVSLILLDLCIYIEKRQNQLITSRK